MMQLLEVVKDGKPSGAGLKPSGAVLSGAHAPASNDVAAVASQEGFCRLHVA